MATTLVPTFYRAASHGPSRSFSPLAWRDGSLVPGWPTKDLFSFDGSTMSVIARVGTGEIEDGNGFISSGADSNSNIWLLTADGSCYSVQDPSQAVLGATTSTGSVSSIPLAVSLPYGAYTGGAASLLLPGFYVTSAAGDVFYVEAGTYTKIGTFSTLARGPSIYDKKLYVALPTQGEIGIMDLTSFAVTTQPAGIDAPAFCASSDSGIWAAGVNLASQSEFSGGVVMGSSEYGAAFDGASLSYVRGTDPNLGILDTVTAPASLLQVVYLDNPAQIVALSESALYIYTVELGVLTLSQTLTVTGGSDLTCSPDQDVLVVGTSAGVALYKADLGVWSLSSTVGSGTVATVWCGATSLSSSSSPMILSASGDSISVLSPSGSTWAPVGSITMPGPAASVVADADENIAVAGSNGASGYVTLLDLGAMTIKSSETTSAPILDMVATPGSKFYALATGRLYSFQYASGSLYPLGSSAVVAGSAVSWTGYSLWVGGAQYQIASPGIVSRSFNGASALIGASTTTWNLGKGVRPSGLLLGAQNAVILLTGTEVATQVLAGGDPAIYDLQVFSGQTSGTPLNLSGAVLGSGQILISTSASGEMVVLGENW